MLAGLALSLADFSFVAPWPRLIVAMLVFILPGACLFALLPARDDWDIIDAIGYGFAFSMALITLLGIITRTLALSIDQVELAWHLLGLLGLACLAYRGRGRPGLKLKLHPPVLALLFILLLQLALYTHASIRAAPTTDDQNRHHAAVNGFLRAEPLGWAEPYYETGNAIADRMYFTYWVLAQALMVEISGAPILLARYLINPFAMLMSAAALYVFARNLRHSRKWSLGLVCLGLFALSLVAQHGPQPGSQFFARALLDKVVAAFALAPVAISSAWLCLDTGRGRAYFAFGLAFLAAVFTHAVSGGFAAVIVGAYCVISLLVQPSVRKRSLCLLLLMLALLTPALWARLSTAESTIYAFEPAASGESYQGISPSTAGDLTYALVLLTPVAVLARGMDARGRLMLAYALAIGFGLLPMTAALYGRLVSIAHVQRVLWLMPYGYMLAYVLATGVELARRWLPGWRGRLAWVYGDRAIAAMCLAALLLTAHHLQFNRKVDFSQDIALATSGDRELLEIAQYIDARHEGRVWVAASGETRSRAIGMHWKVIELSRFTAQRMAYYSRLPLEEARMQLDDNLRLYQPDAPVAEKLAIIDRYGIDYLLFPEGYAWIVDGLYQQDKARFELVYLGETLRLVRAHDSSSPLGPPETSG